MDKIYENTLKALEPFTVKYIISKHNELTVDIDEKDILDVAKVLKLNANCLFVQLTDACGVDYLHYGFSEWVVDADASASMSRARSLKTNPETKKPYRFAMVYHLLSFKHNARLRLRVCFDGEPPVVTSVSGVWPVANWYEREAFDLYGIQFIDHPDCRRILTDYGFSGHPLRKDFPLSGKVEIYYDAEQDRCVYQQNTVEARVTVPKVIRHDQRYYDDGAQDAGN